jgi:hypothetical protein
LPHFGSLRSFEQLDALAQRYHCRPSDLLSGSYTAYCIDEACAIAGEAKDARALAAMTPAEPPPRRVGGRLIGAFHREV